MRRRRRGSGDEITLFPFLAVLICTMGSLIVLLVVVVQQAKATASKATENREQRSAQQAETLTTIKTEVEDLQWRIDMLAGSRDRTQAELEREQLELSYLEDEIRQLRARLYRAANEAEEIEKRAGSEESEREAAEARLKQLREKLDYAKEALAQAREHFKTAEPAYSIVTYRGPHGTRRRPLFVECRSDRIILQPEGIELFSEDFEQPITDNNPLAAALRAQREYLSDATAGQREEPPYPLLLIRPDGAQSYAAARAAMKSWDAEFGYELISAEMKLAYPPKDEGLAEAVREAVEEARARRELLQQMAPARFGRRGTGGGGGGGMLTASPRGGFVVQDRSGTGPGRPTSQSGSFGTSGQARPGTGEAATENPFLPGGTIADSDVSAEGRMPGQGGTVGSSETERGEVATRPFPRSNNPAADRQSVTAEGTSASGTGQFAKGGGPAGKEPGETEQAVNASGSRSERSGGEPSDENWSDHSTSGVAAAPPGATHGRSRSGEPAAATATNPSGSGSAGGSGSGGNPFGSPNAAPQSLAGQRGQDWGLPNGGAGSTGITRPIPLIVTHTQLTMLPEDRRGEAFELQIDGPLRDQIDPLVTAIWDRMETWGIAGYRMHWKPVLQIEVRPNGEARFEELAQLLQDSGIVVQRK